jgi:hypothetical protein
MARVVGQLDLGQPPNKRGSLTAWLEFRATVHSFPFSSRRSLGRSIPICRSDASLTGSPSLRTEKLSDEVAKGRSSVAECEKHSQPVPLAPEQVTADLDVGGGLVVAHRRAWVETSEHGRNDRGWVRGRRWGEWGAWQEVSKWVTEASVCDYGFLLERSKEGVRLPVQSFGEATQQGWQQPNTHKSATLG